MEWIDLLKAGDVVLGILVTFGSALFGILFWWDRRNKGYANAAATTAKHANLAVSKRLEIVEVRIEALDKDVETLSKHVAQLPEAREFNELAKETAGLKATVHRTSQQVDTLYRAALAAGRGGEK